MTSLADPSLAEEEDCPECRRQAAGNAEPTSQVHTETAARYLASPVVGEEGDFSDSFSDISGSTLSFSSRPVTRAARGNNVGATDERRANTAPVVLNEGNLPGTVERGERRYVDLSI